MDVEADLFFTFYGLNLLTKGGADKAKIKYPPILRNIGTGMFKKKLKKVGYEDPSKMLKKMVETGKVRLWACSTTMELLNIKKEDLIEEVEGIVGAATFLDGTGCGSCTSFIKYSSILLFSEKRIMRWKP